MAGSGTDVTADTMIVPATVPGAGPPARRGGLAARSAGAARFLGRAAALALAMMAGAGLILGVALVLGIDFTAPGDEDIAAMVDGWGPGMVVALAVFSGVTEELAFRAVPLGIAIRLGRRRRWSVAKRAAILAPLVLATSVAFALAHGGHLRTLAFQGPLGVALAVAFLREERRGWWRATLFVMAAHAFYDLGALFISQALGI